MDRNVKLNYSSTLNGSILNLTCKNEMFNTNMYTDEQILNVTCHSNGNWIPDPAEFTCSSFTTPLPGIFLWSTYLHIHQVVSSTDYHYLSSYIPTSL